MILRSLLEYSIIDSKEKLTNLSLKNLMMIKKIQKHLSYPKAQYPFSYRSNQRSLSQAPSFACTTFDISIIQIKLKPEKIKWRW